MTDNEYRMLKQEYMDKLKKLPITELAEHVVYNKGEAKIESLVVPAKIISDRIFYHNVCDQTYQGLEIVRELKDSYTSIVYTDDMEMFRIVRAKGLKRFLGRKWVLNPLYRKLSIEDMYYTLNKKLDSPGEQYLERYSTEDFSSSQFYNTIITNDDNGLVTVVMSECKDKESDIESVTIEFYGDEKRVTVKHKEEVA